MVAASRVTIVLGSFVLNEVHKVNTTQPQFLEVPLRGAPPYIPKLKIAHLQQPATRTAKPCLVWLQGFKSEMTSTKASHLAQWCAGNGLGLTRFDYSGHGQSEGKFEEGTLGQWLGETIEVVSRVTTGPQILVGSSMGGFLALLAARHFNKGREGEPERIAGLVLIAPAWDMVTELMWPRLSPEARMAIERTGVWLRPSQYGDGPYPLTKRLLDEGRGHILAGTGFDPRCPVRIVHGVQDPDVPVQHSLRLIEELASTDVRLTLIKDGEHRLSRLQDLALLTATIGELAGLSG
jgi:alpha-beta hydrolase superfamily lysophospholipase